LGTATKLKTNTSLKALEKSALKSICAFLNTDGGVLIIGVTDKERTILDLENDYKTLQMQDNDGFQTHLINLITQRLKIEFLKFIELSFPTIDNKEICKIKVYNSNKEVFYKEGNITPEFWVRTNNGSRLLPPPEAVEYIREHWK
jgi:predicted HTH transcriptional regulator